MPVHDHFFRPAILFCTGGSTQCGGDVRMVWREKEGEADMPVGRRLDSILHGGCMDADAGRISRRSNPGNSASL